MKYCDLNDIFSIKNDTYTHIESHYRLAKFRSIKEKYEYNLNLNIRFLFTMAVQEAVIRENFR